MFQTVLNLGVFVRFLSFAFIMLFYVDCVFAIDLGEYKEKMRYPLNNLFGSELTSKLIGKKAETNKYQIPTIPEVEKNATDSRVYDKKYPIFNQGSKYNKLTLEQKRGYRVSYIKEVFQVTRKREVKDEDLVSYLNVIEQGGSREGVYRRVVNDEIYRSLEEFPAAPTIQLITFVSSYGKKYLATNYSMEGMKKVNLFTIKKIVTEKTLEVIDLLARNSNDVYAWYAIFSKHLALNYKSIFNSKVRSVIDEQFHYNWAKEVPFQHIKSEVIIKLHKVLNKLNE